MLTKQNFYCKLIDSEIELEKESEGAGRVTFYFRLRFTFDEHGDNKFPRPALRLRLLRDDCAVVLL